MKNLGFVEKCFDDWDVINTADLPKTCNVINLDDGRSLIATWSNNAADKAASAFQKIINGLTNKRKSIGGVKHPIYEHFNKIKWKQPLGHAELRNFLDSDGRIVQFNDLKQRIFEGGVEADLRKIVWRHLLNIYPQDLESRERMSFLKISTEEYYK